MIGDPKPGSWKNSADYQGAISYEPKPPDFDIVEEDAETEIRSNFPGFEVVTIKQFGESMGNRAFLVNGEYLFRFPRSERGADSFQKEVALLPELIKVISLPIPNPEHIGHSSNNLPFLGYKLIPGKILRRELTENPDKTVKPHIAQEVSQFLQEIHSFSINKARELGVPEPNLEGKYRGELEKAREILYSVLKKERPDQAQHLIDFIERNFSEYFANPRNFEYEPALLHGDLESEHIIYSPERDRLAGIIDFGSAEISDPDSDLWRPYFHYGKKFIDEMLKSYPHSDPEFLFQKMDFYIIAQMVHRLVRTILSKKNISPQLDKFQYRALEGQRDFN